MIENKKSINIYIFKNQDIRKNLAAKPCNLQMY